MTKGITGKEPDPREVYTDIIDLPRHVSDHHPQMSLYDRAAQFSPFAALSGYDDMVAEEARLVDRKIELSEDEREHLDRRLNAVREAIEEGRRPKVSVTRFVPDPLKAGGKYETSSEVIRKVDTAEKLIILDRTEGIAGTRVSIPIEDILDLQGDF